MISRGIPSRQYPQWGCFEKDQAEALASLGHKVIVMSVDARFRLNRGKPGLTHLSQNGVEYYNYVTFPAIFYTKILDENYYIKKINFWNYKKLFNKIVKDHGKPDILYTQFLGNTVMGVKLKELFHIPVVGIEHLSRFNERKLLKSDLYWGKFAFNNVDKLLTVSESLKENIKEYFNVSSTVVPNILGREFLDININSNRKIYKPFTFVATGSLVPRKGFDILIKSFVKSELYNKNCILKIIGEGPEHSNLEKEIKESGMKDYIKLVGKQTKKEIVDIFSKSNVFVLSSRSETFGVVCIEALAVGLPNIATICGGPEFFITKENGVLVPTEDINKLSEAMQYLYENYSLYDPIIIQQKCLNQFSPDIVANQLIKIFIDTIKSYSDKKEV